MPVAEQEPEISEAEGRGSLAHAIGLEDFDSDAESGIDYDTVIFYVPIPIQYLERIKWDLSFG